LETLVFGRQRLRAFCRDSSSTNPFFGMKVLRSTDMGKSFKETKSAPAFPKEDGRSLANIWRLEAGGGRKDLCCGVEPASLFRRHDGGDSWDLMPGISNHEHARKWQPGNGGLCMHTIIRDGNRVHVGISTGGHYLSEDGGDTFKASNQGVGAGFAPDPYPEFGQCVHKIARPSDPTRSCPGGAPAVWRSENGGESWSRLARGLPKKESYFTVLRDAMARRPISSESGGRAVSSGTACWIRGRRSTTSRSQSYELGYTATTLLDGKVLLAGGGNASTEILDRTTGAVAAGPAMSVARTGHLAQFLPNNNTVLGAGGTTATAAAWIFVEWQNQFQSFGNLSSARTALGAALPCGARRLGWLAVRMSSENSQRSNSRIRKP